MDAYKNSVFVVVGRVSRPFGIKGWSHITSFTEPPENLVDYRPWALRAESDVLDTWDQIRNVQVSNQNNKLVARIENCDTRTIAETHTGKLIGVPKTSLPPLNQEEFYFVDLIGATVLNEQNEELGVVEEVFESGAHPVMRVIGQSEERMIPFVKDIVKGVKPGLEVRVSWRTDWG